MASEFHTLHDFMVYAKGNVYLLMGAILVAFLGFFAFITGRDEKKIR